MASHLFVGILTHAKLLSFVTPEEVTKEVKACQLRPSLKSDEEAKLELIG
ncbi:MAG: hypothetical protein N3B16_02055 [Candidatus Aminicenantes bacterium]|nr:hypothetical protein [Candidatus Aminicenantes bacterium]